MPFEIERTAANNFQGNEFTFSVTAFPAPGVLTLPVFVRILPDTPLVQQAFEGGVTVAVDPIGTSHQPGGGTPSWRGTSRRRTIRWRAI